MFWHEWPGDDVMSPIYAAGAEKLSFSAAGRLASGTMMLKPPQLPSLQLCRRLAGTAAASLLAASYGLAIGWAAVACWQLQLAGEQLQLADQQRSWIVSALYGGVAIGSPLGGRLGGWLGPRRVMLASVPVIVGANAVIFFASSYGALIAGRLLSGLGCGLPSAVYMLFISGTSRPRERGLLAALSEVAITGGTVAAVAAGQTLSWRWLAVLCAAVATVLPALVLVVLPDDPVWLLRSGRDEEARRAAETFGLEISEMAAGDGAKDDADAALEKPNWSKRLCQMTRRRNLVPLALLMALFFFRAFSGYYGILSYSLEFFQEAGIELDASLTAILFGGVSVAAAVVASVLIDRVGRLPLLLASTAATGLCYLGLVLFYQLPALHSLASLPVILLLTAGLMFYVGLGCVPYCLVGELLPSLVRPLGGWLVPVAYCGFSAAALMLFPPTVAALGPSGLFLCHAAAMAAAFLVVLLALPETRGVPLADVETLFQRQKAAGEKEKVQGAQTPQTV